MPRIRTIKPEMASDRKLATVSRGARLTFVLLITQSDDDGLVLGSPRQLLGQLYPHDEDVDLATLSRELRELCGIGLVRMRETVDEAPVVELCNWAKHQRIDHRAKSLILPHLRPLSHDPRETLATPSRDSRAPTLDLGPTTKDRGPSSSASVREAFTDPEHVEAYDGYRRSHRMPDGFDAALRQVAEPITGGESFGWPVIGQALVEMRGASTDFTPATLRGFCRRIVRPAPVRATGNGKQGATDDAIAEGVRRLNAAGVNRGE